MLPHGPRFFKTGASNHSTTSPELQRSVLGCYRIRVRISYARAVAPLSMASASLRSMPLAR